MKDETATGHRPVRVLKPDAEGLLSIALSVRPWKRARRRHRQTGLPRLLIQQ